MKQLIVSLTFLYFFKTKTSSPSSNLRSIFINLMYSKNEDMLCCQAPQDPQVVQISNTLLIVKKIENIIIIWGLPFTFQLEKLRKLQKCFGNGT